MDDIETFEDVALEHNEQMRIIFSEFTGEKAPGNSLVFDISKFKVDGEYKATAFGVDGKHKDKWVEDWAKTLFPYDPDDKLTEEVSRYIYTRFCLQWSVLVTNNQLHITIDHHWIFSNQYYT